MHVLARAAYYNRYPCLECTEPVQAFYVHVPTVIVSIVEINHGILLLNRYNIVYPHADYTLYFIALYTSITNYTIAYSGNIAVMSF